MGEIIHELVAEWQTFLTENQQSVERFSDIIHII